MGDPLCPLRWGPKLGFGAWSTFCIRSGYYKEPNGFKKLTTPGLIRNVLKMDASVVNPWSTRSILTFAVLLELFVFLRKPQHERFYQRGQPLQIPRNNQNVGFVFLLFSLAVFLKVFVFLRKPANERGYQRGQPLQIPRNNENVVFAFLTCLWCVFGSLR